MKTASVLGWLSLAVILMTGWYNNQVWLLRSRQSRMPAVAWSSVGQQADSFARDSLATLLDEANGQWVESYNRQKGDVGMHYLEKAVFFPERSVLIQGNQAITNYYTQHYPAISTIQSVRPLRRFVERPGLVVYEIGEFTTGRPVTYAYLIVWKKSKGAWYRELEAIAEKTTYLTLRVFSCDKGRQPDNRGLAAYLLVGLLLPQELLVGDADSINQQEVPVLPTNQLPTRLTLDSAAGVPGCGLPGR